MGQWVMRQFVYTTAQHPVRLLPPNCGFAHLCIDLTPFRIIYADLTDDQKTRTLQHLISSTLEHKTRATGAAVITVATEHRLPRCKRELLIPLMRSHKCHWNCLVREADAVAAGEIQSSSQQPGDFGRTPLPHSRVRVRKQREVETAARVQRRADNASRVTDINHTDIEWWRANWPQEESGEALKEVRRNIDCTKPLIHIYIQLIREHRKKTSETALRRGPCSFCNHNELTSMLKHFEPDNLDISILDAAVDHLKIEKNQPAMQSHTLYDGRYQCCVT